MKLGPSKAKRRQKRKDEADARRAAYFEELISINRIGEKKK